MIIVPDDPGSGLVDETIRVAVTKVFDGDGFLASVWNPTRETWVNRVAFRMAFIDAPELEQPYGQESRDALSILIAGKTLSLDPIAKESMNGVPLDPYKRVLCMAYLTEEMERGEIQYYLNGACHLAIVKRARPVVRNIELEMIVNGWAWVIEQYSFEREEEYFAAQDDARAHGRGLWASNDPEPPWEFKRRMRRGTSKTDTQGRLF